MGQPFACTDLAIFSTNVKSWLKEAIKKEFFVDYKREFSNIWYLVPEPDDGISYHYSPRRGGEYRARIDRIEDEEIRRIVAARCKVEHYASGDYVRVDPELEFTLEGTLRYTFYASYKEGYSEVLSPDEMGTRLVGGDSHSYPVAVFEIPAHPGDRDEVIKLAKQAKETAEREAREKAEEQERLRLAQNKAEWYAKEYLAACQTDQYARYQGRYFPVVPNRVWMNFLFDVAVRLPWDIFLGIPEEMKISEDDLPIERMSLPDRGVIWPEQEVLAAFSIGWLRPREWGSAPWLQHAEVVEYIRKELAIYAATLNEEPLPQYTRRNDDRQIEKKRRRKMLIEHAQALLIKFFSEEASRFGKLLESLEQCMAILELSVDVQGEIIDVEEVRIHSFDATIVKAWGRLGTQWFPLQAQPEDKTWQFDTSRKLLADVNAKK